MKKRKNVVAMMLSLLALSSVIAGDAVNLISNGDFKTPVNAKNHWDWKCDYCYLHNASAEAKKCRDEAKTLVKWSIKDGVATINKPEIIAEVCGNLAPYLSGGIRKYVELPDDLGGKYKFSMNYRAKHNGAGQNYLIFTFHELNQKLPHRGKVVGKMKVVKVPDAPELFSEFSTEIDVPKGAKVICIVVRIDGVGSLDFTNASLTKSN